MGAYIVRRLLLVAPTLLVISIIAFVIIELPPGDYVSNYIDQLEQQGTLTSEEMAESFRHRFGFDRPGSVRYLLWVGRFVRGDFGFSLDHRMPVREVLLSRLALTMVVALASLLFSWIVAFPIAVYSATHQYSVGDYFWTFVGFIGLSIPNFLFALVLMILSVKYLDTGVGGLFSQHYQQAGWSLGKVLDLLKHLWIPAIVVGTASTAGLIRILRANLLDELKKPYVDMARAKGVAEVRLVFKYPVRVAINPFISSIGWVLPFLVSGAIVTSVVLDLPTAGPIFLRALRAQDMPMAGAFVMLIGFLTTIGTLVSDILLAILDPRIRFQ